MAMPVYANGVTPPPEKPQLPHYHGDFVRLFFIIGGIIMTLTLPFFVWQIPVPFMVSIVIVLGIAILAGFTNPRQRWLALLNFFTAAGAFLVFEYHAVTTFMNAANPILDIFFIVNQLLAIDFFLALYFSVKTVRGMYIAEVDGKYK